MIKSASSSSHAGYLIAQCVRLVDESSAGLTTQYMAYLLGVSETRIENVLESSINIWLRKAYAGRGRQVKWVRSREAHKQIDWKKTVYRPWVRKGDKNPPVKLGL